VIGLGRLSEGACSGGKEDDAVLASTFLQKLRFWILSAKRPRRAAHPKKKTKKL
jgi:hypothetical protein